MGGIAGPGQIDSLYAMNSDLHAVQSGLNALKDNMKEGKLCPNEIKRFMEMMDKAGQPAAFSASVNRNPDRQLVNNVLNAIQFFQVNFSTSKAGQEASSPIVVAFFKSLAKIKSGLSKTAKKKKVDKVEKVEGADHLKNDDEKPR